MKYPDKIIPVNFAGYLTFQESDQYNALDLMNEESYPFAEALAYEIAQRYNAVNQRKKIVCYCGSLRFKGAFQKAEYESLLDGHIALLPCCMFVDIQREYGAESDYKIKADELHKRKIDLCDEMMVLNVGGYIGASTRSEIEYAVSIGKPIKYLEPNHESV